MLYAWFDSEHDTLFVHDMMNNLAEYLGQFDRDFVLAIKHVFLGICWLRSREKYFNSQALRYPAPLLGRRSFERQVMKCLPNLKTLYFHLLGEKLQGRIPRDRRASQISPRARGASGSISADPISPRRRQPGSPLNDPTSAPHCPYQRLNHQCHRCPGNWQHSVAFMPRFDVGGPFELDPAKPHEARMNQHLVDNGRGGADTYYRRIESHIAHGNFWRYIAKRRRGSWILAEWSRTPSTMGSEDLVRIDAPVSEFYVPNAQDPMDDDGEGAVLAVQGRPGFYPANGDHPWVKACLPRLPEMRFVLTL